MITLGLDTTGALCTATIVGFAKVRAHRSERIGRGHAERLAPMVQEVLRDADMGADDIQRIAVCTGPGSFTGLRVALSFARAFALPGRIPVIGLSGLQVLAAQADPERTKKVVSVMDVRRGELNWAAYDGRTQIQAPVTQTHDHAKQSISKINPDLIVGDGAGIMGIETDITDISGAVLAWLGSHLDPTAHPPDPLYSRGPDAKLPGGKTL